MIYDIPVRSGRKMDAAMMLRLAREVPNVVALKDAAGNPAATATVVRDAPDGFEVYSGDDALTLPLLAVGAVGAVGVATHWTATDHQDMFDLWEKGDTAGARMVNTRMLESFAFETGDDAPKPAAHQGGAATPRPARRSGPPPDGRGAGVVGRAGAAGARQPAALAGCVPRKARLILLTVGHG